MHDAQIIEADWTWTGERFEPNVQVMIESDGVIHHVGILDASPTHRLKNHALLPGMINAHSHAFQRGLRGYGETFPEKSGSFWGWREAMYGLVEKMDADMLYALSHQAFVEMLHSGITTVGEFHYLHHETSDQDYAFDEVILRAAADAGIRIILLNTYYKTGGLNQPLNNAQKKFGSDSVKTFWQQMDRLSDRMDDPRQSLGVVAHSIRAVPIDDVVELFDEARRRNMVFHMHVEEQRKEIEECINAHEKTPMAMLNDRLEISDSFTAIHCTHTDPADMKRFIEKGGNVCICPLTEANLGDGIADLPNIMRQGGKVCVGTDSNARICMTEELRWLEYVQRVRQEARGLIVDDHGSSSRALWDIATQHGARSLGIQAGRIAPGFLADFLSVDLQSPSLFGWSAETLLDALIFGTGNEAISAVCVGGRWINPVYSFAKS